MIIDFRDRTYDGFFAICVLKLTILMTLSGLTFSLCEGWKRLDRTTKRTFFGFRFALSLFTFNALINVIYEAVIATGAVKTTEWYAMWLVGIPFAGVARAVLAYALVRITQYPLRCAGDEPSPHGIAQTVAAFSGFGSFIYFVFETRYTTFAQITTLSGPPNPIMGYEAVMPSDSNENGVTAAPMGIIDSAMHLLVGAVCLGMAIYNYRKSSRMDVPAYLKRAGRMMLVAAPIWIVAAFLLAFFDGAASWPAEVSINPDVARVGIVLVDMLEVTSICSLFVLSFRREYNVLPR